MKRSRLIVFCGPPCSGKSPVSCRASEGKSVRLEMDTIRNALFEQGSNTPEERRVSYAAMHYCAEHLLKSEIQRVSLVATYQPFQQRQAVAALMDKFDSTLLVIQFKVDPEDAVRRFWARPDDHPARDLTADRVRQLAKDFKYYHRAPIIDTSRLEFEEWCSAAHEALDADGGPESSALTRKFATEWVELARGANT